MKNKTHRSSTAKLFNSSCPKALEYYENNVIFDRDIFQPGIVAHAIAQRFGELNIDLDNFEQMEQVADAVVKVCISEGRSFDGIMEPPIKPDHAFSGKEIAMTYFMNAGFIPDNGHYENGLGMKSNGEPCAYDDAECRWQAVLDCQYMETIEDENYTVDAAVVCDYKSAFPTKAEELDTIQLRGQAVLAWVHNPDVQAIVQEVVNLRTWATHRRIILLDDEGQKMLSRWRNEILLTCQAMDTTRDARPGAGCLTCFYSSGCDDCLPEYSVDTNDTAIEFVKLETRRKDLIKVLKGKITEDPIKVANGFVGYKQSIKKKPTKEAEKILVEHFFIDDTEDHPHERALLKAIGLTGGNINAFIKAFYPDKNDAAREDIISICLEDKYESRFGVHKS